jgi:cytochrome P450
MGNERLVRTWQAKIIETCEQKLARPLLPEERKFITDTAGFLALEMIHDTVAGLPPAELAEYLGSGRDLTPGQVSELLLSRWS